MDEPLVWLDLAQVAVFLFLLFLSGRRLATSQGEERFIWLQYFLASSVGLGFAVFMLWFLLR